MSKSVYGLVGFVIGAAVGSLAAWKLLEKKYADIADEEIASVKEAFYRKDREKKDTNNTIEEPAMMSVETGGENTNGKITDVLNEYITTEDHPDYSSYSANKKQEEELVSDEPYVISPEEFNEFEDYEVVELTYYRNGVLLDDLGDPIEEPGRIVGDDFEEHFGEYEDDCVFIRNDKHKCDYQILLLQDEY